MWLTVALSIVLLAVAVTLIIFALVTLCPTVRQAMGGRTSIPGLLGPRGRPLVGNALEVDRRRPYFTFTQWSKVYGDAFVFNMFSQPVLVLSSLATIREATLERGHDYAGRPTKFRSAYLGEHGKDIVSASISPSWLALKKIVLREIKRFDPGQRRMEALTLDIVHDLLAEFRAYNGRPFDPRQNVYNAIMNTICLFLTGEKFRAGAKEMDDFKRLERLITTSMNVGGEGTELDVFPWLRFFGNRTFKKLKEAKKLRDELYAWAKDRVETDLLHGRKNVGVMHGLFGLLTKPDEHVKQELTEENVKLTIVNLLIGGSAATTTYLYLLLNVLVHNKVVQGRLRAEVDAVVGRDRRANLGDRQAMPYAKATLIELLRYGSLSPILIPHLTVTETSIKGVPVQRGVWVFLNVHAVHHEEDYWGDPFAFRPERFLEEGEDRVLPPEHPRRQRVLSFGGGGPRACPGEAMAWSRLFLAVVSIVQEFTLQPPDESGRLVPCDPRTYDMGLVLSPQSYSLRCVSRS